MPPAGLSRLQQQQQHLHSCQQEMHGVSSLGLNFDVRGDEWKHPVLTTRQPLRSGLEQSVNANSYFPPPVVLHHHLAHPSPKSMTPPDRNNLGPFSLDINPAQLQTQWKKSIRNVRSAASASAWDPVRRHQFKAPQKALPGPDHLPHPSERDDAAAEPGITTPTPAGPHSSDPTASSSSLADANCIDDLSGGFVAGSGSPKISLQNINSVDASGTVLVRSPRRGELQKYGAFSALAACG